MVKLPRVAEKYLVIPGVSAQTVMYSAAFCVLFVLVLVFFSTTVFFSLRALCSAGIFTGSFI